MQLDPKLLENNPTLEQLQENFQSSNSTIPVRSDSNPFVSATIPTSGPGDGGLDALMAKKGTSQKFPSFRGQVSDLPNPLRYPTVMPGTNYEELYATSQGALSKWGNALVKMAGITATTFLNGTAGLINGVGAAATNGKMSSFYDNDTSRALDSANKYMEDRFPNYYTKAETDADWYSPKNWLTANFWGDKVVKNLGYAAGAALSGVAWAKALQAVGMFSKIASVGKSAEAASALEDTMATVPRVQQLDAASSLMKTLSDKFNLQYNVLDKTQRIITAGMATHSEAAMEALQGINEFRQSRIDNYIQENGTAPTGEDLDAINKQAEGVGNWRYGLNLALLSATNYVQFPKILGSSYKAEKALYTGAVRETEGIVKNAEGKFIREKLTGFPKLLKGAQNVSQYFFSPSEAFEEGAQNVIDIGTKSYFNKKYQNKDTDFLSAMGEGVRETLTSKEGIESILIGGLSGAIFESFSPRNFMGKLKENRAISQNTQSAVDAFNKSTFSTYVKEGIDAFNRGSVLQKERSDAIKQGDILEVNDLQYDYLHNYLTPRIKYGRYDLVKADIATQRQLAMTDQGLDQLKADGIISQDTTREEFLDRISNIERHTENIKSLYNNLNVRYGSLTNKEGKILYSDQTIDAMVYATSKIADYDQRIPKVARSLISNGISIQPILDSLQTQSRPSTQASQDALNQINNLDVLSETKEDLRQDLRDTVELSMRRKQYMKEYDTLKNKPQSEIIGRYGQISPEQPNIITIPQPEEEGKVSTKELEVGKEYPTSSPIFREGNKLGVFPSLKVLGYNPLGELQVQLPTGETIFTNAEQLGSYKLTDDQIQPPQELLDKLTSTIDNLGGTNIPAGSLQEKIDYINSLDNKDLVDKIEEQFNKNLKEYKKQQEEIDKLRRNKTALDALDKELKAVAKESGNVSTGDPNLDATLIQLSIAEEGKKKSIQQLFISSTSPDTSIKGTSDNNDSHRRANKFLNNFDNIVDSDKIQVIPVTYTNQNELGLPGLIPEKVPNSEKSSLDPEDGIIRLVFIKDGNFIDQDGNSISKLGEKPNFDELVYQTLPSTSLSWQDGEDRYITIGPRGSAPEQAKQYKDAWLIRRSEILKQTSYQPYQFSVSRGIPNIIEGQTNSVVKSLVSERDLNSQIVIIPTQEALTRDNSKLGAIQTEDGNTIYFPLGRPVLKKGSTIVHLNNRKLTSKEKENISKLLPLLAKKFQETNSLDRVMTSYLQAVLFMKPFQGQLSSNQLWVDTSDAMLYLGSKDNKIPFIQSMLENSPAVTKFLDNAFINTNNYLLTQKFTEPFNEIIDIQGDSISQVQWKSYQHFLLSPEYVTTIDDVSNLSGKKRLDIPLTTNIVDQSLNEDIYASSFEQKYVTLQNFDLPIQKVTPAEPEKKTTSQPSPITTNTVDNDIKPVVKAGNYILDGNTINNIKLANGVIVSFAATWTTEGVQVNLDTIEFSDKNLEVEKMGIFAQAAVRTVTKAVEELNTTKQQIDSQPTVSETKEVSKDAFKDLKPPTSGVIGGEYNLVSPNYYNWEDNTDFQSYMEANLPQVPAYVVNNLIRTTDGGYAFGVFTGSAIYVYKNAPATTKYHEAFEAVYNSFLTSKEQKDIISEFKNREGSFTDAVTGKSLTFRESTDKQAKEQIADEFGLYNITGQLPQAPKRKSFFKRLLDFIKNVLIGRPQTITNLFSKINSGYFSTSPVPQKSVDQADENYSRIPRLNTKFIHDTIQGMSAGIFKKMFADNRNIINFDEGRYDKKGLYDELYSNLQTWFENDLPWYLQNDPGKLNLSESQAKIEIDEYSNFLLNSWDPIKNNWEKFIEQEQNFLKPFGIIYDNDSDQDELESNINTNENKNYREYEREELKFNVKKNASAAVKLLFGTATQTEKVSNPELEDGTLGLPQEKLSSLRLAQLVEYGPTFNRFLHNVVNTNGLKNILSKLKDLAKQDSKYVRIYKRLKVEKGFNNLSIDDWKLLMKIFTVASKQKPIYNIQMTDVAGGTYFIDSNNSTGIAQIKDKWFNNLKINARNDQIVFIKGNNFRVNNTILGAIDIKPLSSKIKFLNRLGIDFTEIDYDNLPSDKKKLFPSAVQSLYNQLKKSADLITISGRSLGASGAINQLAEIYISSKGDNTESQHFNVKGEAVQNFILNNYVSFQLNDINAVKTKEELFQLIPQLQDIWSSDSLLLENGGLLFDDEGVRRDDPINVIITEGSKNTEDRKGKETAELTLPARRLQEFNQNLKGKYYTLLPADSKTEWGLDLGHFIHFSEFENVGSLANKINRIFRDYLRTEILTAQENDSRKQIKNFEKNGKNLRFFKDILSEKLNESVKDIINNNEDPSKWLDDNKEDIQTSINNWLKNLVDSQISFATEYNLISQDEKEWQFNGLDSDFQSKNSIPTNLTEGELRNIFRFRTLNYVISNIEMHKIFFGDPVSYSDATKRIKSYLSGRETTYHTDEEFNISANDKLNRTLTGVELQPGDPGYHIFKDYISSITISDVNVVGSIALDESVANNIRDAYEDTNEADAQSYITLPAYREFLLKAGGRWTDQMEEKYQYVMAKERQNKKGYKYSSKKLENHDKELAEKGSPNDAIFPPLKPIGSGVKYGSTFMDMFLDKTSMVPLYYDLVKDRNLEGLYNTMMNNGIGYSIMDSGRKVGAESFYNLYNEDGSTNTESPTNIINIPFKYLGIQVETGGIKENQTRGSQLAKQATMDLLSNGIPVDVDITFEEWNKLAEETKEKRSPIYKLVRQNKQVLEALSDLGYQKILNKLDISETENGYKVNDLEKIAKFIKDEIERRELPENIREAISVNPETNDWNIPLEALNNYPQIKRILYSIVDKYLLSPKMPGGPKVQVSSTLFEKNKREAVYKKNNKWTKVEDYNSLTEAEKKTVRLTSNELKFYTRDEPYCEILLPNWFRNKLPKGLSDEKLIELLNKNNSKLLYGIGFRIPTQGLNSVERFKVKGFLPAEFGDSVVVPTEIVVKAGSDFDIDKLNTYLKNFYINHKGLPEAFTFLDGNTTNDDFLKTLYEHIFSNKLRYLNSIEQDTDTYNNASKLIDALLGEKSIKEDVGIPRLEEFILESKDQNIYDLYAKYAPKILENKYIETLEDLLSLPQNFDRLIQPNSSERQKKLRDELNTATNTTSSNNKGNYSLLLDPQWMSKVRHNFMAGKGGVGIAAVQQNNNALNQLSGIVLNPTNFRNKLTEIEKSVIEDLSIALPHNTISYEGNTYVTLSSRKDIEERYISDKISSYINGFVDVANDPFIIELGAELNVASTYMMLEKIGVPGKDVIFFMNQPIIREYLKELQIANLKSPVSWTAVNKIAKKRVFPRFPAESTRTGAFDTKGFKSNIEKYYKDKTPFTQEENAEQQQVLSEFLKYYILSQHLFKIHQGTNYDTANFNEPYLIYLKQRRTEIARKKNLWSSVDKILNNSFIGRLSSNIASTREVFSKILKLDTPEITSIIEGVIEPYISDSKFISEDDFLAVANNAQLSFLDYITQVKGELNSKINSLFLSTGTSVAKKLQDIKNKLSEQDSDLSNNPILVNLQSTVDSADPNDVKNIKLVEKAHNSFTSNLYTDSLRELRDNVHTSDLYKYLIELAILQSGVKKTPISFTDLIPVEDYSKYVTNIAQNLDKQQDLYLYDNVSAFQRNNWKDERIVPTIEIEEKARFDGSTWVPKWAVPPQLYKNLGIENRNDHRFVQLHSWYDSSTIGYPVVKVKKIAIDPETAQPYTKGKQKQMSLRSDYSYITYELYKQVTSIDENGSSVPFTYPDSNPKNVGAYSVLYRPINAWGKPYSVQEYYDTPSPSVLPSNKSIQEIDDNRIIDAYYGNTSYTIGDSAKDELHEEEYKTDNTNIVESIPPILPTKVAKIIMQPDNIQKILDGTKTSTVRSSREFSNIGIAVGESALVNFGGSNFTVTNEGYLSIEEAGGLQHVLNTEGVNSIDDFKFKQTKEWANGKGKIYYYTISSAQEQIVTEEEAKKAIQSLQDKGIINKPKC